MNKKTLKKLRTVIQAILLSESLRISEIAREIKKIRKLKEWGGYDVVERSISEIGVEEVRKKVFGSVCITVSPWKLKKS